MECVVTGARGFVGRGLIPVLAAAGHVGTATGRRPPADLPLPPGWRGASRGEWLARAPEPVPAAIVHLEVEQRVPAPTPADPQACDRVNVGGTRAWLDWAAEHGVGRFVFVSSISAFAPGSAGGPETRRLETGATYGGSKARAEAEVRRWVAEGAGRSAVILRPAPVYGPAPETNFAALARRVIAGRPAFVGPGTTPRSVLARRNLAAAIAFALEAPSTGCAVFEVSDPAPTSVAGLAALVAELTGAPAPRSIPPALARVAAPLADLLGWLSGRDWPLSSRWLEAHAQPSVFPSDRLVAAGFVHPQSTREGLGEMLAWLIREDRGRGAGEGRRG